MTPNDGQRIPLIYVLHSGRLYGTERMALATAAELSDEFAPLVFAPPGQAISEARAMGFGATEFRNVREVAVKLLPHFVHNHSLAFVATGVVHSLLGAAWAALSRCEIAHLHVVHGGTDERLSYGRKRCLNNLNVTLVAVSSFVRDRLLAHHVRPSRIRVVENFLRDAEVAAAPQHSRFCETGIRHLLVVSRLDPIKRVDLLFDAFDSEPDLHHLDASVLGDGYELEKLRLRASAERSQIHVEGFRANVAHWMAQSDLLVHLCPVEPFGLAILEAMAAGVPALVPDRGGAGDLVEDGISGFRFKADDAVALATRLKELSRAPAQLLNRVVEGGRQALSGRFSAAARVADYRALLHGATP
jgi:glycosyltransferase involved in cell wall biosynthesis